MGIFLQEDTQYASITANFMRIEKQQYQAPMVRAEWKEPIERAKQETETRNERLERLWGMVNELFPSPEQADLRREIERSFHVPQWGEYHNEGMFMDRHFEEILHALEDVESGKMPENISPAERQMMQDIALRNHDALQRYVFLHDISKADLLRIESLAETGQKKGKAWEGSLEQWYAESGVEEATRTNPSLLYAELTSANLKGVSYYHQGIEVEGSGRKTEASKHGEDGKSKLETMGDVSVSHAVLEAIERHEVAYQFESVKVDTYRKYFESLGPDERGLALVASFVDTMGSWRKDGKPDLTNFLALLDSKHNYEVITELDRTFTEASAGIELNKKKVEAFFLALRKQASRITGAGDLLLQRSLRECKPTEYDADKLRSTLAELVSKSELAQAEMDEILGLVQARDMSAIGKKFGKKMKTISIALKASEKN